MIFTSSGKFLGRTSPLSLVEYSKVGIHIGNANFLDLTVRREVSFFGFFGKWKNEESSLALR